MKKISSLLLLFVLALLALDSPAESQSLPPYKNPNLPVETRVNDLMSRLTLEEKFSVRWTGKLTPPESGNYTLGFTADDGARLYIDGKLLVDAWASNPNKTVTKEIALEGVAVTTCAWSIFSIIARTSRSQ